VFVYKKVAESWRCGRCGGANPILQDDGMSFTQRCGGCDAMAGGFTRVKTDEAAKGKGRRGEGVKGWR
jgi:hypothetical protein